MSACLLTVFAVLLPDALLSARPGELVLIGPFRLDELYRSANHINGGIDQITKAGGPATDEMLKAMKDWKVYIIDRKVKENDRWVWDRPAKGGRGAYPKVLIQGEKTVDLKDKAGKTWPFTPATGDDFVTELHQGRGKPGAVARMGIAVGVTIHMREFEVPIGKNGGALIGDCFRFRAGDIWYDVTGKYELQEDKPKKEQKERE